MKRVLLVLLIIVLVLSSCQAKSQIESSTSSQIQPEENSLESTIIEEENSTEIQPSVFKLVVPEGFTIARIGMRLEEMGICSTEEFLEAAQSGDFSEFPLVAAQQYDENRCFVLEGYLFPDTYEIYPDEDPDSIIRKMLSNNEKKYNTELREKISQSGYSIDEIITIASIIQKEAYERNDNPVPQEMPLVSSVLHNRLKADMMLQCNVTATYVNGVLKEFVDNGFERYNDYYNTYHCPALPAGAICNPGIDSIEAAVSPTETDYLFFLTDENKNFYYSSDYDEHLKLVEKYLPKES